MSFPRLYADFVDLLSSFLKEDVSFLLVGAFAVAAHGVVRATGDLDVWVRPDEENARRVWRALSRFGAPLAAHRVTVSDFAAPGTVYQMGLPPMRIDVLTHIDGVVFDQAWDSRIVADVGGLPLPFLGRPQRHVRLPRPEFHTPTSVWDLALAAAGRLADIPAPAMVTASATGACSGARSRG